MKLLSIFLSSALVLCASLPALALSVLAVSLEQLSTRSELVFEGAVISVQSTLDPDQVGIHTFVTFRVVDVIKGEYLEDELVLRFLGGTVGDIRVEVADSTFPAVGEEGIYFVESLSRFQVNPFYGMDQGHFLILTESRGQQIMMTRSRKIITGFIPEGEAEETELSRGIVQGVEVDGGSAFPLGVTAIQFKQKIRELVQR